MRLTVIGCSPAWENEGGACSGYLVEERGHRVLIDCGNGVFGKLRELVDYAEVDEVLLSHLHADHFLDLVPYAYALTLGRGEREPVRPKLHLPPGAAEGIERVTSVWGSSGLIEDAFETVTYERGGRLQLGPIAVSLTEVPHFTLTHAIELTAESGRRVVFGADCRRGPEIVAAAREADVLIAEATLPEPEPDSVPIDKRGHMSGAEAGEVAREAGVGRLILTHMPDVIDQQRSLAEAAEAFGGKVELAREGLVIEL